MNISWPTISIFPKSVTSAVALTALLITHGSPVLADSLPQLPNAITSFGACVNDGWVYVYGGHSGTAHQYTIATTLFDFQRCRVDGTGTWESLPGPVRAQGASLIAHSDSLYLIGGMSAMNESAEGGEKLMSLKYAARFDPKTQTWEALPDMPAPRSSHDAIILNDSLYVLGGWTLSGTRRGEWPGDAYVLNLQQPQDGWTTIPQPFKRRAVAVAVHAGKIFVMGGMDTKSQTSLEVDIYDPESNTWTSGPQLPKGPMDGFGASACTIDNRVFVSTYSGLVYTLNQKGDQWVQAATAETPRFFHRMVPADEQSLLLIGGASRKEGHLNTIEAVSIEAKP